MANDDATGGKSTTAPTQAATSTGDVNKPGKRTYNPLGKYASYTYNISLYMISPNAYNAFVNSGRKKLNLAPGSGTILIAQSGGADKNTNRAEGFSLDYYIDNLKIVTPMNGKDSDGATFVTELSFNVTEPYGFSFISNLKRAADQLVASSPDANYKDQVNQLRQFFMLGIRFTGFDLDGKPITKDDKDGNLPVNYERFFDILITEMKFKLDKTAVVYNIKAATIPGGVAFGTKRGIWDTGSKLTGTTVYEMLVNMMTQLNQQAAELAKQNGNNYKPNRYSFKFVDGNTPNTPQAQASSPIFASRMKTDSEIQKAKLTGIKPTTSSGGTPAAESSAAPLEPFNELTLPKGTPILQAFEILITRSSFILDAFKVIQTNSDSKDTQIASDSKNKIKWYMVSANCTPIEYVPSISDYTWNIEYVFELYETPFIQNSYSNLGVGYYGPAKVYDYYFTGRNSEIISYVQDMNNAFFTVAIVPPPPADNSQSTGSTPTPTAPGKQPEQSRTDTQNQQDTGKNSFVTSLYDPGAYAKARIKILGDPDFLVADTTSSVDAVYNKFYGTDGVTVKANGGQVFIEVNFHEGQDYNYVSKDGKTWEQTDTGLMSFNDQIQFWNYPKAVLDAGVKGVSYMILSCTSSFTNGKFEQDLNLVINTFPGVTDKEGSGSREGSGSSTASDRTNPTPGSTAPSAAGGKGSSTGLLPSPPLLPGQKPVDVAGAFKANTSPILSGSQSLGDTLRQDTRSTILGPRG